jgi:hypothetical protein
MFARRGLPSDLSLLDRHHGQDHAQIAVRVVWRCTGMLTPYLATASGYHPRQASHPFLLARALSQPISLFSRRHLGTHLRGVRDGDLASSEVRMMQFCTHRSHGKYESRDAKDEKQVMRTMQFRGPFEHAAAPTGAVLIGHEAPRSAKITLWLS